MRLVPESRAIKALENDYAAMQDMLFGKAPAFQEIMSRLKNLQEEINSVKE